MFDTKYNKDIRIHVICMQVRAHIITPPPYFDRVFRKIIGKNDFPYHFKKIIVRYKKIGYNINVMRQTACLVVNPIKVNSFAYLFNGRSDFRLNDGTILNLT